MYYQSASFQVQDCPYQLPQIPFIVLIGDVFFPAFYSWSIVCLVVLHNLHLVSVDKTTPTKNAQLRALYVAHDE